jgi:hypothetical protein
MGARKYKNPKTGKDSRYDLIRVMYDDGKIERFSDIVKYVRKTVIANDIRMDLQGWDKMVGTITNVSLKKYFQIAALCGLTEREMMGLIMAEYEALKAEKLPPNAQGK